MNMFKRNKPVKTSVPYKLQNHVSPTGRQLPGLQSSNRTMQKSTPAPSQSTDEASTTQPHEYDPQAYLEVFESHWQQAIAIMLKNAAVSTPANKGRANQADEVSAVTHYIDQMMLLLVDEKSDSQAQGPILQFLLSDDILEKLLTWCIQNGEFTDKLRLHQLKMYDMLISQSQQALLVHKPVIRPLLKLLSSCAEHPNSNVERSLILLLHQLCICLTRMPELLELFFSASLDQGPTRFLMFSLLIPYVHRDGDVGQQARDALLLIMSLSCKDDRIGRYIAENSDFCPVLATGLSGLYSILPRKIDVPTDDWCQITDDDITAIPDLKMFLYSLEFCNAVIQVAHSLVRDQLLKYLYDGFLVPVLGPALHQTSLEEVIAATAYLELFLRRISEPALVRTFLKFILIEKNDDVAILESLITRIHGNSRLCMVTLALFHTLIDLNCEDVMFQIIFKYLIPCTHVMVSQRRAVKDIDIYSKTAEKFLTLIPACCVPDVTDSPPEGASAPGTPEIFSGQASRAKWTIDFDPTRLDVVENPATGGLMATYRRKINNATMHAKKSSSPDNLARGSLGTKLEHFETSYIEYLEAAKERITLCHKVSRKWVFRYDGESPCAADLEILDASLTEEVKTLSEVKNIPSVTVNNNNKIVSQQTEQSNTLQNGEVSGKINEDTQADHEQNSSKDQISHVSNCESKTAENSTGIHFVAPTSSETNSLAEVESFISLADISDLDTFMNLLNRVKTPDNSCATMEDTLNELEALVNAHTNHNTTSLDVRRYSRSSSNSSCHQMSPRSRGNSDISDYDKIGASYDDLDRDSGVEVNQFLSTATTSQGANGIILHAKSESNLSDLKQSQEGQKVSGISDNSALRRHSSMQNAADVAKRNSQGSKQQPSTPARQLSGGSKYSLGKPDIGPFLSALLTKLETMMQNTLYVNLLLTGLIMRLACFPQPLIRSFLLNHTLVFQPTVKSLIQVLSSVKHKVDCFSYTVNNFEDLLLRARRFMAWREETYLSTFPGRTRSESITSLNKITDLKKGGNRKGSLGDFLFRRNQNADKNKTQGKSPLSRLQSEGTNYRYINAKQQEMVEREETLKTKNAVYCALVLEEFLKELAAVAQEHGAADTVGMAT